MTNVIKKAIIPVAGMGTRFLPATKAQPKEMLSVVDKPVIQYIVEEAVSAGIEEIIFVTAVGKRAIEDHFDRNFELEYRLKQKQKNKELKEISDLNKLANFAFVRQKEPLGDGHAVLAAVPFVNANEPVAVLFGDDIIESSKPAIAQLMEVFKTRSAPVVGIQEVPKKEISKYGVISGEKLNNSTWKIEGFVEKPHPREAPSNLAAVGRYVITPEIFEILKKEKPGRDGEIRLANAFATYLKKKSMYGCKFSGKRYDCGNKLQFTIAQIELGLKHPEIGKDLKKYFKNKQSF